MTSINSAECAKDPISVLADYLEDAYLLRQEMRYFENDRALERDGWTFHYAVDTDVIKMLLNPHDMGYERLGRKGYGVVFCDDTKDEAINLAGAMARFLFYELVSADRPFLLLHGHDAEVRGLYETIIRAAEDDSYVLKTQRDQMLESFEKIASISTSTVDSLADKFPEMMNYLFLDKGKIRELERFQKLLNEQSVSRVRHAINNSPFYKNLKRENAEVYEIFTFPNSILHQTTESSFRIAWKDRLSEMKNSNRGHSLKADYSALARVELLNNYLHSKKHKVVLITGDLAMKKAAESYVWKPTGETFSSAFLRQPRAFLTAPEVIAPFQNATTEDMQQSPELVTDWLDYLLAFRKPGKGVDTERLIIEVGEDVSEFVSGIRKYWSKHIDSLKELYGVTNLNAQQELRKVVSGREKSEFVEIVTKIAEEKTEQTFATWNDFLEILVTAGYALLDAEAEEDHIVRRNAPAVMLGNFESAYLLMQKISSKADGAFTLRKQVSELTADHGVVETNYVRALSYGVLFASRGCWTQAAQLADHALLSLSTKDEDGTENCSVISGREAHYLKAISTRIGAKKVSSLEISRNALSKAISAHSFEVQNKLSASWERIRFDCENVNIDLTEYLFDHFVKRRLNSEKRLKLLLNLGQRYQKQFLKLAGINDSWIRANVVRSLSANILMISALCEGTNLQIDCESAYESLEKNLQDRSLLNKLPPSFLDRTLLLYARCKFFNGQSRYGRHSLKEEIDFCQHQLKDKADVIVITPYDRRRYSLLLQLSRRHIALSNIDSKGRFS